MTANKLKVTLVKSPIGRLPKHRACVKGLGLKRMHHSVEVMATPENLGMLKKVAYLVQVTEL